MSCECTLLLNNTNPNLYFATLGSTEGLNSQHRALLDEFQSLQGADQLFLLECAAEAVQQLNETKYYGKLTLSEWGPLLKHSLESHFVDKTSMKKAEKEYGQSLIEAYRLFLDRWNQLRTEKTPEEKKEIFNLIKEGKAKINSALELTTAKSILQELEKEGYQLQNPSVLRTSTQEVLEKGAFYDLKNDAGESKRFWILPTREVKLEVHSSHSQERCFQLREDFSTQVNNLLNNLSESSGNYRISSSIKEEENLLSDSQLEESIGFDDDLIKLSH